MKKFKICSIALLLLVLVACALTLLSCDTDPCANGHTEVTDAAVTATCSASGLTEGKHCSVCSKILVAQTKVEKKAHAFDEWTVSLTPTCTQQGSRFRTCADCGVIETQTLDAHTFENWVVTAEASCGKSGLKTSTCTECGTVKTETIDALSHQKSTQWERLEGTSCEVAGKEGRKCTRCAVVMETRTRNAGTHDLDTWKVTTAATCVDAGEETSQCKYCNYKLTRSTPATGHTPGTATTVASSCTEAGTKTTPCTKCDTVTVEILPLADHNYGNWITDSASTCYAAGTKHRECSKCGRFDVEQLDTVAHTYSNWTTVSTASCTQNGEKQRQCSECHYTDIEIIPTTAHTTDNTWTVLVEVTNTNHGFRVQKCTTCLATIKAEVVSSPNPSLTFSYLTEGDSITITGYGPYAAAELVIPEQIGGKNVTKIAKGAFASANRFTSITFPSTLTVIEAGAFDACTLVSEEDGLLYLNNWIVGCNNTALTTLTVKSDVLGIAEGIFADCTKLNDFVVADDARFAVENNYLYNKLTGTLLLAKKNIAGALTLPNTIKAIASDAFKSCFTLYEITIPNSVKRVGTNAFAECYTLVRVMNLSGQALGLPANPGKQELTSGSFTTTLTTTDGIVLYKPNNSTTYMLGYVGESDTLDLTGKGVTAIYQYALYANTTLKTLTIPTTVQALGNNALAHCELTKATLHLNFVSNLCHKALKSLIILGDSNTIQVPSNLLTDCTTLEELEIPNTILVSHKGAFAGCTGVKVLRAPANALGALSLSNLEVLYVTGGTSIAANSFKAHKKLREVHLAPSVEKIGGQAFYNCTALTTFIFDDVENSKLTDLGTYQFCGNTKMKSIVLPPNLTKINGQCFSGCTGLTSVTLPKNLVEIAYEAFHNCSSLASITIPASVTIMNNRSGSNDMLSLKRGVFSGCTSLKSVTFESGSKLEMISTWCFYGCTSLTEITIPASVTTIGCYAFANSGITKVTFENTSGWNGYKITANNQILSTGFQNLSTPVAMTIATPTENATKFKNDYAAYTLIRG